MNVPKGGKKRSVLENLNKVEVVVAVPLHINKCLESVPIRNSISFVSTVHFVFGINTGNIKGCGTIFQLSRD